MEVSITSVISARDFGVIFTGISDGRKLRFKALTAAIAGSPIAGEVWRIEGQERSTQYGPQIDVVSGRRVLTDGSLVRRFIAAHVRGIGPERAGRLWTAYGESLRDVMLEEGRLVEIAEVLCPGRPALGCQLATAAMRLWRETTGETQLLAWLDEVGIADLGLARRLYRLAGDAAIDRLKANPYALVPLVPWPKLDHAAQKILVAAGTASPAADPRRLVGAVDEAMKRLLMSGSTRAASEAVQAEAARLLNRPGEIALSAHALVRAKAAGAILEQEGSLAAPGAAAMEKAVLGHLLRLQRASGGPSTRNIANAIAHVSSNGQGLHDEQRRAVEGILASPVSCLSGGAGVGKTFTCRVICDAWETLGGSLLLCSLAGKAALRLSRSTKRLARTLARTIAELGHREPSQGTDEERFHSRLSDRELATITPRTLVVVDEASMVDLATMHALLRRMPDGARLLMVGDEAQLPPVGFGLIFHKVVADPTISFRLTYVHRQAAETGIPAVAAHVRDRRLPKLDAFRGRCDGATFIQAPSDMLADTIERVISQIAEDAGETLVVTATHDGPAGVTALNERLQEASYQRTRIAPARAMLGRFFAAGEPVIFGRNDYRNGLFNGMMGRVTETFPDGGALEVLFDGELEPRLLEREHLVDLHLAYAVTCHRCQGSSAPRIVIPLYRSRVLEPSWIYTAVTRAERQVVFVGDLEVLSDALKRPRAAETRCVGFEWKIPPG